MELKSLGGSRIDLNKIDALLLGILVIMVVGVTYFLFYQQVFHPDHYVSDVYKHITFVKLIFEEHTKIIPHIGFQSTIYYLSKLLGMDYFHLTPYVLTASYVINFYLLCYLIAKEVKVSYFISGLVAISLLLLCSIYLPIHGEHLYRGPTSPNPWHNPTYFLMKPFAVVAFYAAIISFARTNFFYAVVGSISLLISAFYKPSFAIVFIPALSIFMLIEYKRKTNAYLLAFILMFPTIIVLLLEHQKMNIGATGGVLFAPLVVLRHFTHHIFISLLRGIAFPLSLVILNYRRVFTDKTLWFAWINTIIAYLYFMLFAIEKTVYSGDFAWGYEISLYILFVFSIINFITSSRALISERFGELRFAIVSIIFLAHLSSGILFFYRIITGHFVS